MRAAVGILRRVRQHAVVAPVSRAGELVDGHQLQRRHAQLAQRRQPREDRIERSFRRERADVNLGDHAIVDVWRLRFPCERPRIDDDGLAMRPVRLIARSRIGIVALGEAKSIASAGARAFDRLREVAVLFAIERDRVAVDHDGDGFMRRRPHAKVDAEVSDLCADGAAT